MTLASLLAAFAVVFPGSAAVRAWDFVGRTEGRTRFAQLGLGSFFGLAAYGLLHALGAADLTSILDAAGEPSLALMLTTDNVLLFLAVNVLLVLGAVGAARVAHFTEAGSSAASWVLARTLAGNTWSEAVDSMMNRWLLVTTRKGQTWRGMPHLMPARPGGHIVLRKPALSVSRDTWLDGNEYVVLAFEDVECIQVTANPEGDDDGKKDRCRGPGQGDPRECEGHQASPEGRSAATAECVPGGREGR